MPIYSFQQTWKSIWPKYYIYQYPVIVLLVSVKKIVKEGFTVNGQGSQFSRVTLSKIVMIWSSLLMTIH